MGLVFCIDATPTYSLCLMDTLCSNTEQIPHSRKLFFILQIELLDTVALNLHRIDKDVQRCDRNYYYFTTSNLEKLRNIMCR